MGLRAAVEFLTVLRLPGGSGGGPPRPEALPASLGWSPLVGAAVGGLAAVSAWAAGRAFGPALGVVLALGTQLLLTGCLHLDGLADTADGLAGWRGSPSRALEIMRDSRIGTAGAAAVAVSLLWRFAALSALGLSRSPAALIVSCAAGRLAMVYAVGRFPYARAEGGLGQAFAGKLTPAAACLAAGSCAALAWGLAGGGGLLRAALACAAGALAAGGLARLLGGLSGDTYGAVNEVAELTCLLAWCWPEGA